MIEQLTEEERARVELVGTNRERRYARIIDAYAADRAALVARVAELEGQLAHAEHEERNVRESLRAAYDEIERLAECLPGGPKNPELAPELVDAAEAELTRLRADRAALVARVEELERLHEQALNERDAAHLEIASSDAGRDSALDLVVRSDAD